MKHNPFMQLYFTDFPFQWALGGRVLTSHQSKTGRFLRKAALVVVFCKASWPQAALALVLLGLHGHVQGITWLQPAMSASGMCICAPVASSIPGRLAKAAGGGGASGGWMSGGPNRGPGRSASSHP